MTCFEDEPTLTRLAIDSVVGQKLLNQIQPVMGGTFSGLADTAVQLSGAELAHQFEIRKIFTY